MDSELLPIPQAAPPLKFWQDIEAALREHYVDPDIEAARAICAALACHAFKEFPPAWSLAIAPPGSLKTEILETFRDLPNVHFVDDVTPNTFLSGKVDERGKKRTKPASLLHRIGSDGVIISADFCTYTSNPKTLGTILSQLRRIYDGNYSREFGTDENLEERHWSGRLTLLAAATPEVDRHYSLFQSLGERFVRVRWPRAGGVETALRAMRKTDGVREQVRTIVHALMIPILSTPQLAPEVPQKIRLQIGNLCELVTMARTWIQRDSYDREANGVPVTEGNTRLPQQLCQIARGSALLDGRQVVNERDFDLARRVAFDSFPPARRSILLAKIEAASPYSLGLPKATVDRALEDLTLGGVLTAKSDLSQKAVGLINGAGIEIGVPETSHR